MISSSRPSHRSRWSSSGRPAGRPPQRRRAGGCRLWRRHRFATASPTLAWAMSSASSPRTSVWPPGQGPLPPKPWSGRGRPPSACGGMASISRSRPSSWRWICPQSLGSASPGVKAATQTGLALRRGACPPGASRIPAQRAAPRRMVPDRMARRRTRTDQVLSLDPASHHRRRALVDATKLRWRIERDYQDLKQELGLGHYEGRGWRGFHHHATLCIAAYGFLLSERGALPPSGPRNTVLIENLPYSEITGPADLPIRPERHVSNSITSVRIAIARAISRSLTRCPCCQRNGRRMNL